MITPIDSSDLKVHVTPEKTLFVMTDALLKSNEAEMFEFKMHDGKADFVPMGSREVKREDLLEHREKDVKRKPSILARMIHEVSMLFSARH